MIIEKKTCRDEIISAVRYLIELKERNEFTINEVIQCMKNRNTKYADSTIRIHISSRCCSNAKKRHHAVFYNDFEKVDNNFYKLN